MWWSDTSDDFTFLLQGGSLLASPFLKGFLAGYIVARLRSSPLLGVAVGTCTGIYAAQNYAVPNIENTIKGYINNLKGGSKWEEREEGKIILSGNKYTFLKSKTFQQLLISPGCVNRKSVKVKLGLCLYFSFSSLHNIYSEWISKIP